MIKYIYLFLEDGEWKREMFNLFGLGGDLEKPRPDFEVFPFRLLRMSQKVSAFKSRI